MDQDYGGGGGDWDPQQVPVGAHQQFLTENVLGVAKQLHALGE